MRNTRRRRRMTGPDFSVDRNREPVSRQALFESTSGLIVTRPSLPPAKPAIGQPGSRSSHVPTEADMFVVVRGDGSVVAFNGHVDLGTGIGTALAQIVAEELAVPRTRVRLVPGHPAAPPGPGPRLSRHTLQ